MPSHRITLLQCLEGVAALAIATAAANAHAQTRSAVRGENTAPYVEIDLPGQPLQESVKALAVATQTNILGDAGVLAGREAPALRGRYTLEQALARLLEGTGLSAMPLGRNGTEGFAIRRADYAGSAADDVGITVTGSRIRGGEPSSLVIALDRQSIEDTGQFSMTDVAHSIPQSFGGGTNPGIGFNVPTASGVDAGGSSSVNLRGLGSEATLTLLNGHRAAYSGTRQGIDISTIPLGMVEKIEVMPDGASALYGSDAVAGVVNVILRRHFDGLETRAQIGGTTQGGGFRQQYGAVGGAGWGTGGLVAGYEFMSDSGIMSDQRDYTAIHPGLTLAAKQRRHAVVVNGHQALGENLTFALDALFNKRWYETVNPTNAAGDLDISRSERRMTSRSITLAPSLTLDVGPWQASLSGVYGSERMWLTGDYFSGQTLTTTQVVCYCNSLYSIEANGDGPLFALPGGLARGAIGGGYRVNHFSAQQANASNTSGSQGSYYAFGELDLPLAGPDLDLWGVRRLTLTGAVRYERYPGIASVATPRLGLIYEPVSDLTLKASWGRTFRAPSLYQLLQVNSASLYRAASLGGATGTALYMSGGNRDLKPERARTWTTSLQYKPGQLPGLDLQVSYFSVHYINRIVTPIAYSSQSLSNPIYADFVLRDPGARAVSDAVASSAYFDNYSGAAYNPATVGAIVDNTYANVGRQEVKGVDVLARYRRDFGDLGTLSFMLNAAWLDSRQQLTPGSAVTELAGTIFNPPHWRGRGSVTWSLGTTMFNTTVSRIGAVTDARYAARARVEGMTTIDLTARHGFTDDSGPLAGLSLTLTVQNLFNASLDTIAAPNYYDTAYDMTNYSALGRYIGVGVTKAW
ncbi:TonB-dependent receptor [Novosphingobium resinovorum]|uniref:Secretin/TonB short N-terminal domain-containing protein n=1 Tax=Novosphingobium resinovorum TaxID=158500 RepID=A0A1D8A2R2_9SPHN|nr:TonB-dependent receptor [Novosphingobium resinovorum]AOR76399.1 hypothetical protein BES08_06265 [Novosphingobium resinovorum]